MMNISEVTKLRELLFPTEFKSLRLLVTCITCKKNFTGQKYVYKVYQYCLSVTFIYMTIILSTVFLQLSCPLFIGSLFVK